jgi:hypothetical protein
MAEGNGRARDLAVGNIVTPHVQPVPAIYAGHGVTLPCDGRVVDRAAFPELYAVLAARTAERPVRLPDLRHLPFT